MKNMNDVSVIVLTGGPCGGKSTALSKIEQELTNRNYKVFILNEMATEVINSGLLPNALDTYDFQKALIQLQLERFKVYLKLAKEYSNKYTCRAVILCDRAIPDSKAYMSNVMYKDVLNELLTNESEIYSLYDGVFNLVTAASGASKYYTLENNSARTETPEEAIEKDKRCIEAYTGHNHLRIITNRGKTFEQKLDNLMEEIFCLLGIPVPLEIERKYLVEKPDIVGSMLPCRYSVVHILQTYLKEREPGVERRIRQRGIGDNFTFYYTEKKEIDGLSRAESERIITKDEYLSLLMDADDSKKQIRKTRYCFVNNGTYFELDDYPFWDDKAILEVELTSSSKTVELPDFIKVIKEVTDDMRYRNSNLAENNGQV